MVILNENNVSIKLADGSTIKLNELGYDTQLADSTNGLENRVVTYNLLKRRENANKIVTKNPADYSNENELTTRESVTTDNYDRSDYDDAFSEYYSEINASSVKTSGFLNNTTIDSGHNNRIYSNDKYEPSNEVGYSRHYSSKLKRDFYNTQTRKSWNYSEHRIEQVVNPNLEIDSTRMDCPHAILEIPSTIRIVSGEAMQFTLSLASGDYSGPLCFSNGVEWLGTRMGASRSYNYWTTNLAERVIAGRHQMLEEGMGSTVVFMSAGVYSLTFINDKWLFNDDACIVNEGTTLSPNGADDENMLVNGTIRIYGSGIIENDFWTRNVLTTNDNRMEVNTGFNLPDSYQTMPKVQFGANSDYANTTNNIGYTFCENFSYTAASNDNNEIIVSDAMNIKMHGENWGSRVGGTQLWNYRSSSANGVQDWIKIARIDVEDAS